jgi:hypothetical protein
MGAARPPPPPQLLRPTPSVPNAGHMACSGGSTCAVLLSTLLAACLRSFVQCYNL